MKKERIYGLDILRIISMLGIVSLHIMNQGGWLASADTGLECISAKIIATFSYCSVNVFAMLTGYLYADRKSIRSSNLLKLIFTTAFYCVAITAVFSIFRPDLFNGSFGPYLCGVFPPFVGRYWYITCYVLLFMMIPYINILIKAMTRIQFQRMLSILFVLFCIVCTVGKNDYFRIDNGYSPFWLIFCYLIGAYVKLHKTERTTIHQQMTALISIAAIVVLVWSVFGDDVVFSQLKIVSYISPFMVIEAVLLLLIFSKITVRSSTVQKCILTLSNGAFGVYLIHSHIFIFDHILKDAFSWTAAYGILIYVSSFFAGLIGIYLICWLIDTAKSMLFHLLRIDSLAETLGNKLDALLQWSESTL